MPGKLKTKIPLAARFYLTLVVPLILVSIAVSAMTFRGLENNASNLADVLRIESKTNRILSLLLLQDDATKAMLIDPNQLAIFSAKKIEAYDAHKQLLDELDREVPDGRFQELIHKLQAIDEDKLRPIDTLVLEKLYEDVDQARRMYFELYEVHKKEYESLIRELAAIGTEDLKRATDDVNRKNRWSLIQISLTLLLGIIVIVITITVLSRQVEKSESNTRSLLDVLSEGLFFFDRSGHMADERSQRLAIILPNSQTISSLYEFVQHYAPASAHQVKPVLQLLWQAHDPEFFSDIGSTLSFLPRFFTLPDQRSIQLDYRPLHNAKGELERVVVVVADVTERLQQEREARFQAERVQKISRAAARQDDYQSFFEEANGIFQRADGIMRSRVTGHDPDMIRQLKRDLHTLKGTLATSDFKGLASQLHELESLIEGDAGSDSSIAQKWQLIVDGWSQETTDIENVLGLSQRRNRCSIEKSKFNRLYQHASLRKDQELEAMLLDCLRLPPQQLFARYDDYLHSIADKLEKKIRLIFNPDSSELAFFEAQKLDAAFNHILRNCVDHGIEDPQQRTMHGKDPVGKVEWGVYRKASGNLHFVIQDDGQGVNATKLAQKAVESGFWTAADAQKASEQDKVELLFLPQLSSRDEVTELSGRGVGMDAVKDLVEKLGGTILVRSKAGMGTRFEIEIPLQVSHSMEQLRTSA